MLERRTEPGTSAAPRQVLSLTDAGGAELLRRLRAPSDVEISDRNRYFTVLALLRHLPDRAEQAAVLQRRLDFLQAPATFFSAAGKRLRAADMDDPFRQGMFEIARATAQAERDWLTRTLAELS